VECWQQPGVRLECAFDGTVDLQGKAFHKRPMIRRISFSEIKGTSRSPHSNAAKMVVKHIHMLKQTAVEAAEAEKQWRTRIQIAQHLQISMRTIGNWMPPHLEREI
jgi:hypothetical protein